jgi:hypothetical protein
MTNSTFRGWPWLALLLALPLLAGCDGPPPLADDITQPSANRIEATPKSLQGPEAAPSQPEPQVVETAAEPAFPEPPPDEEGSQITQEIWDAYSMQGSRIGYSRTTIADVEENGQKLVRTRNYLRTRMMRAGQPVDQSMAFTTWETEAGKLVRFDSKMTAGPGEVVATGEVRGDELAIEMNTLGKTQASTIPWQTEWGGFFAPEQSLRHSPMQPGETRTVTALQPLVNAPGETRFTAIDYEMVKLPAGEAKLLRIESVMQLAGQAIETTLWVDEQGETQKSLVASLGQEVVRTTKEDALRQPAAEGGFDLLVVSTVPLVAPLNNAPHTKQVVYRAHMTSGKLDGVFANCLSQRVKMIDDRTAEITVLAVRPDEPAKLDLEIAPPDDDDRQPNSLIQSDDPAVIALAQQIAPGETDPWKLARALEKHVDDSIKKKNFSQAFATAAEVVRSLEGDCTEHAVLLAALCRARSLPARVAFGLVYYPPEQGFAYHMWNEVWIEDRWVPLDATLGLGGIGGDHLKLDDSSLAGASAYTAMLPVIQVFGRLELEVLDAQ